jgi:hypothetical protein
VRGKLLHWDTVSSSIVLIGPSTALPALRDRADSGAELHTFTDAEALEALDHIIRTKPRIIALDREFSATSRGLALINRINADTTLRDCEIRVVALDSAVHRAAGRRSSAAGGGVAVEEPEAAAALLGAAAVRPLDQRGTRRAHRIMVREGVEVLVDGNPAALIDISTMGAQVLSAKMLKPNQRVRVALPESTGTIRCDGAIAWATFEMPKGESPRYRAGIELAGDPAAITTYADRHRKP